ncbi:hypothetical protein SUDANB105_06336 [Streptomyces sp. enrichment culture]|uniref:hypothetical protein n=1 Tax=Streptomyces sp. enrichment culture TaxID=1795815 RepID=UPI003F575585
MAEVGAKTILPASAEKVWGLGFPAEVEWTVEEVTPARVPAKDSATAALHESLRKPGGLAGRRDSGGRGRPPDTGERPAGCPRDALAAVGPARPLSPRRRG